MKLGNHNIGSLNKKKQKVDFSQFIETIIARKESDTDKTIEFNMISEEVGIEKRRLYDLMNVFCSCGVCVKTDAHFYQWKGLNQVEITLLNLIKARESQGIIYKNFQQLFPLPESPSIGLLTTTLLSLFLYLGTQTLILHEVSKFLTSDVKKEKQITRRLYLVTYLLEQMKVLKHGNKNGEYEINYNVNQIVKKALNEISHNDDFPPYSIEYQLNRFDDSYILNVHQTRYIEYLSIIRNRSHNQSSNIEALKTNIPKQMIEV
ncbi:E2F/DP winged-helix DNA-binding domain [Tritrichomonas musculus]|uniref:E2F/DP winged-helix DNA-binding domain n=1 Tax=Tritrichomonas musculus TaxID=1915356 RepID=A0ABR2K814_9EUKA